MTVAVFLGFAESSLFLCLHPSLDGAGGFMFSGYPSVCVMGALHGQSQLELACHHPLVLFCFFM